jgi:hypothetical protein
MVMGAFAVAALVATGVLAADALQSGPPTGKTIPGPFHPLNVTGDQAGQKFCQVWKNGNNPVAMIFAREVSDPLTSLVKKIDAETIKHKSERMGSFVVFLSDDEGLQNKLKSLAEKQGLKQTVLTIDNPAGPKGYNVAKDADVTVVLYDRRTVKANYAFKKGGLNDKAIERIIADIPKIVPKD